MDDVLFQNGSCLTVLDHFAALATAAAARCAAAMALPARMEASPSTTIITLKPHFSSRSGT